MNRVDLAVGSDLTGWGSDRADLQILCTWMGGGGGADISIISLVDDE